MVADVYDPNCRYVVFKLLRLILAPLYLATFVFHFSSSAQAPQGIGRLSHVIGKVEVLRSDETLTVEKDFVLFETDEVITFDKTAVKIVFYDGSNLMAFQNATVKVAEYKIKAKGGGVNDVKSDIDIVKGKVRFFVKPQEKNKARTGKTDAKFKTSNSVMEIHGTSGFIDASVSENTQIIVTTGSVQVTSIADPSKSVVVPANQFTEVFGNKAPTIPKEIPPVNLNKLNSDAVVVDPNYKKNEELSKKEGDSKKDEQQKKNDEMAKHGSETGSTTSLVGDTVFSREINSATIDQRKQVFHPDGTSTIVSTDNSLNELLVSQGNTSVRPTSYGDYDPIKNSLQQVSSLTNQISRQINTIIQTNTTSQINIMINKAK